MVDRDRETRATEMRDQLGSSSMSQHGHSRIERPGTMLRPVHTLLPGFAQRSDAASGTRVAPATTATRRGAVWSSDHSLVVSYFRSRPGPPAFL